MSLTQEQRVDVERLAETGIDHHAAVAQLRETFGDLGMFEAARVFDAHRATLRAAESIRVHEVRPL